ncbi:MAG: DUF371 domain-containing protein [Nitrososphaerota archaeon]
MNSSCFRLTRAAGRSRLKSFFAAHSSFDVREVVSFFGHANILALHPTTLEITRAHALTPKGDCIVGVRADKASADLSDAVKGAIRQEGRPIRLTLLVGGLSFSFLARGSEALSLSSKEAIIVRKSSYTNCKKTIAIRSEAAAADLPRALVALLREGAKGELLIEPL